MCINPAWMIPVPQDDGSVSYQFFGRQEYPPLGVVVDEQTGEVFVPFQTGCGQCLECMNLHKLEWVHRLLDEASLYDKSVFLTLTFRNNEDGSPVLLEKKPLQDFIKRVRKYFQKEGGQRVRYYAVGEYGSNTQRPHYHCILFGIDFSDRVPFRKDKKGFWMSRSKTLESLWTLGISSCMDVVPQTLEYVTKDMQKFLEFDETKAKPFSLMSLKPGIGAGAVSFDSLRTGKLYHNGKTATIPRYYLHLLEKQDPGRVNAYRVKMYNFHKNLDELRSDPVSQNQHLAQYCKKKREILEKTKVR